MEKTGMLKENASPCELCGAESTRIVKVGSRNYALCGKCDVPELSVKDAAIEELEK